MKALTISQPYASLIASREKFIENRTWPTTYRGPIAIHAGKGLQYLDRDEIKKYPTGCVIAIGRLIHCIWIHDLRTSGPRDLRLIANTKTLLTYGQCFEHVHAEGPYCWILEDVQRIEPVPCRGAQGLWNWKQPSLFQYVERPS